MKTAKQARDYSTYYAYKAAGICVTCGRNDALPNNICCESCAERKKEGHARWMNRIKEENKCYRCGKPNDTEHTCCTKCKALQKRKHDREYRRRKKNLMCYACGGEIDYGCEGRCQTCIDKHKFFSKKRRAAVGPEQCIRCRKEKGEERKDFRTCTPCAALLALQARLRRAKKNAQMVKSVDTGDLKSPAC